MGGTFLRTARRGLNRAAMSAGRMGRGAETMNGRQIYRNRAGDRLSNTDLLRSGRRRVAGGAATAGALSVVNGSRAPSSGRTGTPPVRSTGGYA